MSKRNRQRQQESPSQPSAAPLSAPRAEVPWFRDPWVWLVSVAAVGVALFIVYKFWPVSEPEPQIVSGDKNGELRDADPGEFHGHKSGVKPSAKNEPDDFLSEFNKEDSEPGKEAGGALANKELEKQFEALVESNDHLSDLKKRGAAPGAFADEKEEQQALDECDRLAKQLTRQSAALEKEVAKAKQARPQDPLPRWLTGELLIIIGGEPEEIAPHLEFAAAHGLNRPRLAGSLARVQLEANRFADSFRTAAAALDRNGPDRYLWDAFAHAAISSNQFAPVLERLPRDFPAGLPSWAKAHQREAQGLQAKWEVEQKIRRAEARADDLPRVRLVIEHRRFARDPDGKPLTTIESTGRGEIVLELFENEAPLTVANFIDLVTRKFYDGTSFHLVLPATMVAGGDPSTRNDDPDDDGLGGPGYVIADEYQAKTARNHFRGSISMVKTTPRSAGSQFFFSLSPAPAMDGNFTVFGRIIEGQDVADQITRGRTTRKLRHFGRIIPGDLLVRAEVVRKRSHEYRAVKEQP